MKSRLCGSAAALAAIVLIFAPASVGCRKANLLSTSDEVRIGQEGARQIEQQYRVERGTAAAARVERIGQRLLANINERQVPYSFKVLDTNEVNAVSLPGGPVYVYKGLLDLVGADDDELAAVVAHEIGHVEARHAAKQISTQLQAKAIIDLLLRGETAQQLAGLGATLLNLQYSRDDEFDADRRALHYLYRAGFSPNGLVEFFEKLQARERGGGTPEFLRTHPVTSSRINRARELIQSGEYRNGG